MTIWIVCLLMALPAAHTNAAQERNEERSEHIELEIREAIHNRQETIHHVSNDHIERPDVHNTHFVGSIISSATIGSDLTIILRNLRI